MRKILFLVIALTLLITACGQQNSSKSETTEQAPNLFRTSFAEETLPPIITDPISENELCFMRNNKEVWQLQASFPKEKVPQNSVTTSYQRNENLYELYKWKEDNTIIAVCNAYYNDLGKDKDCFYVNRISTRNKHFKTTRNIFVGSALQDIIKAYGMGFVFGTPDYASEGFYGISYNQNGNDDSHRLTFYLDKNSIVNKINLDYFTFLLADMDNRILDADFWP